MIKIFVKQVQTRKTYEQYDFLAPLWDFAYCYWIISIVGSKDYMFEVFSGPMYELKLISLRGSLL